MRETSAASVGGDADPRVQATDVAADAIRGMVMTRVPVGATTGNMKISAGGLVAAILSGRVTDLAGFGIAGLNVYARTEDGSFHALTGTSRRPVAT